MSPKIVDKEIKKQDILKAAVIVFARQGITNTKMIDIAVESGIGKGTIYEYFSSKDEIIKEAFRSYIARMDEVSIDHMEKTTNPVDKICNIIDGWMDIVLSSYEESKLIIDFWAHGLYLDYMVNEFDLKELYNKFRIFLSMIIEQGISEEKISPVDSNLMASLIIATLDGLVLHCIIGKELFDLKDAVELFKKSTLEPLRNV